MPNFQIGDPAMKLDGALEVGHEQAQELHVALCIWFGSRLADQAEHTQSRLFFQNDAVESIGSQTLRSNEIVVKLRPSCLDIWTEHLALAHVARPQKSFSADKIDIFGPIISSIRQHEFIVESYARRDLSTMVLQVFDVYSGRARFQVVSEPQEERRPKGRVDRTRFGLVLS